MKRLPLEERYRRFAECVRKYGKVPKPDAKTFIANYRRTTNARQGS